MKIVLPDLISNSYFPALAAVELGFLKKAGIDATIELLFPVSKAYEALRRGDVDCVAGSGHSALAAFPEWQGCKLLCAQAQGMYWFLVMRSDIHFEPGDLEVVKGRRIGAAPWVDLGLKQLLVAAGIDERRDGVSIGPVPNASGDSANFGLTAAKALEEGAIDGFWANGMAAEIAVQSGSGKVLLDVRRGDGPAECFDYTMASMAVTDQFLEQRPAEATALIQAVREAHKALKADVSLASEVGRRRFPQGQAALVSRLVERDLPYYSTEISRKAVREMNRFARSRGVLEGDPAYEDVVASLLGTIEQ